MLMQRMQKATRLISGHAHIDVSHLAATPPGLEITANVELMEVVGKKLVFSVAAHDGIDLISKGRHERFVVNKEKFDAKVNEKKRYPCTL